MVDYLVKGKRPRLLIHSGIHGDEYGVIASVKLAMEKYRELLPDFVFVPEVSPSAVERKQHINRDGVNLNRSFFDDSPIEEVRDNMEIIKKYAPFDLCVTFHEEPEYTDFYMYQYKCQKEDNDGIDDSNWLAFKKDLDNLNIGLLNGIDDPNDPILGYKITDGYRYFPQPKGGYQETGELEYWAINRNLIHNILTPEVPTHLSSEKKNDLVDLFFRHFLLKA